MKINDGLLEFCNLNRNIHIKKGALLFSNPFLSDKYFEKSVILICKLTRDEIFGFVLNNYSQYTYYELFDGNNENLKNKFNVGVGGPVSTTSLFYIHKRPDLIPNSYKINKDLYFGGDIKVINELMNENILNENEINYFLGYSGWELEQFKDELASSSWIIGNIENSIILENNKNQFWENHLEKQSVNHKIISRYPKNPIWN